MRGTMTVIKADGTVTKTEVTASPSLKTLQEAVGGYLEVIPGFFKYENRRCVAYCDEEGKLKRREPNPTAQALWNTAVGAEVKDMLCGDVVILTGDRAFMLAL